MIGHRPTSVWPPALRLPVIAAGLLAATIAPAREGPESRELPIVRRILVPADRENVWPAGNWQPVALADFERLHDAARAADRGRPGAYLERAAYSAKLVDYELRDARLEWTVRRPHPGVNVLSASRLNLNISQLDWAADSAEPPVRALWGTTPEGSTAIIVDRSFGRLVGTWSLPGRRLAASTEFDLDLPPSALSQLTLRIPAELVLTASAGELSPPVPAPEPGWNEWRLDLGSQTSCRLRAAPPADVKSARPLILVRDNLNYYVKSEAVRVLADFDIDVLESSVRELRLSVDPEIQVTAVEYGDDSVAAWKTVPSGAGQEIIVQLPDPIAGPGHSLQVQGIAQVKQFAPWVLPRIRLQNSVEAAGRATVRLQSPQSASDIRTDGYRQIELTSDADEGEILVFRQMRGDGTITIVPADGKPEIACRATTLIVPERHQWSMAAKWEWTATAGNSFAATCAVAGVWEIEDVRAVAADGMNNLSGWDVQELEPGRRVLQLFFLNALQPDRPTGVRVSARRVPPVAGESAVVPPLVAVDAGTAEQFVVVSTSTDLLPVLEGGQGLEPLSFRELPPATRSLDFLVPRLEDDAARTVAFRISGKSMTGRLRIEPAGPLRDSVRADRALSTEEQNHADPPSALPPLSASPVSLELAAEATAPTLGFDHYVATYRMARQNGTASFEWRLPHPAELIGVEVEGRPVIPFDRGAVYSVSALPSAPDNGAPPGADMTVAIEYRVPAAIGIGPNSRPLLVPETDRPVLHFDLALHIPQDVRLGSLPRGFSFDGHDDRLPWFRRLLGPFARGHHESVFNPLQRASWPAPMRPDNDAAHAGTGDRVWRAAAAHVPSDLHFVIWNAAGVRWLCWMLLFLGLLAGVAARLTAQPLFRSVAIFGIGGLCLGSLAFSAVVAELVGSALTGVILSLLLPRQFLVFWRRPARTLTADVPVGSTQSFVPIASLFVAVTVLGLGLAVFAQELPAPPATKVEESRKKRSVVDVLVPVGPDGKPAGEVPVAYVPAGFMAQLQRFARPSELPAYLISTSTFDGIVDDSHRLRMTARFEIHVFASQPVVPVHLPLGLVNLGGADACLVDGRPHPVLAGPEGRGLVVDLSGAEPLPATPALPEQETGESGSAPDRTMDGTAVDSMGVHTSIIELHLYPPVDAVRPELLTSTVGVPPGCQTRAMLSSPVALPVLGISPSDAVAPSTSARSASDGRVEIRPGPTKQVVFYWSATPEADPPAPDGPMAARRTQLQAGVSCLADFSSALVEMRYHIAYRVEAGRVHSLVWLIPAGYILESIQAPQLAGYRFELADNGDRRMLIEFSRPQTGDFSLAATFAFPVGRNMKQFALALIDPVGADDSRLRQTSLRFHQLAVRQPSDLKVNLSAAPAGQAPLRPRPIDEFLKEWNAAGARPQQAFDLERSFALNAVLESLPAVPAVRASSIARFHLDHLDWTWTAEVTPATAGQFAYHLHVDPRIRIRSVAVREDDADRLLRWSPMRDTLVLFLNDRATRAQTVRIDALLPLSPPQEIELPRIRFEAATPGPERVTLFHDAGVSVGVANPEDFPLTPLTDAGPDASGDRLVARLDVLPEQSNPRLRVTPVVPQLSAQTASVLESRDGMWRMTTCVAFQVAAGRVSNFVVELPESLAAVVEARSLPESWMSRQPTAAGRVALTFHADDPTLRDFRVILSAPADVSRADWQLPDVRTPDAEAASTLFIFPQGAFEPAGKSVAEEAAAIPEWLSDVVPSAGTAPRAVYRWPGGAALPAFRSTREPSARPVANPARLDLWINGDGTAEGSLALNVSGRPPRSIEFLWPETARPTGLFIDGEFRPLPLPANGVCAVSLPEAMTDRMVWLSWIETGGALPVISGPLSAHVPWPREIPVENLRVRVHAPRDYRVELAPPRSSATEDAGRNLVPSVLASKLGKVAPPSDAVSAMAVPEHGMPFTPGASIKLLNQRIADIGLALAVGLVAVLLCWRIIPAWRWLIENETVCWLALAAFWWLCLTPSWFGPVMALWACMQVLRRRRAGAIADPQASTAHAPPAE
jgi:hypothetical protein